MARTKTESAITKQEAVRLVLEEMGKKADAEAVLQAVKERYGLDISRSHFFNIKSTLKKQSRKRGRPRKTETTPAPAASPGNGRRGPRVSATVSLADLEAVKELAKRYGSTGLTKLIEVVT